jgi:hypothetical protein
VRGTGWVGLETVKSPTLPSMHTGTGEDLVHRASDYVLGLKWRPGNGGELDMSFGMTLASPRDTRDSRGPWGRLACSLVPGSAVSLQCAPENTLPTPMVLQR